MFFCEIRKELILTLSLPLIFEIITILIKELHYYRRQRQADAKLNEENECLKLIRLKNANFKDKQSVDILEKTKWGDLQIGDIILLKKDEYCPADILILDMWDQKCTVKTSFIDDQSDDAIKYAPLLTTIQKGSSIKGNLLEYRRILSGRIDLKKTDEMCNFRGYLSLKKDPINEKFGCLNIIQKYSQIQYTDWLLGIVVLCGNDSYSFRKQSFERKEKQRRISSYFKKKWDLQSIIQILMICFFSLIVIILRISMSCFKSLKFKGQMIPIAIDFILTFPSYCSIINSLGFYLYVFISNYKFKITKKDNSQNQNFDYNYSNSLAELAQNSHVIINSFKIQNQKQKTISTVCLKDRFFKMRETTEQSNSNNKLNNTILRQKQYNNQTKSEIGDEQSYYHSPINNINNQKINGNRISASTFQIGKQNDQWNDQSQDKDKMRNAANFRQVYSSTLIDDDSTLANINLHLTQSPSNGVSYINQKKSKLGNQSKQTLQKIIEMDSKSVLPQLDNESYKDELKTENSNKNRQNSNAAYNKSFNHQNLQKTSSLATFDDNNLQTFAENSELDISVNKKVGNHLTKKYVSITTLNQTQPLISQHFDQTLTQINFQKTQEEVDISAIHSSHRGFMQDAEFQNQRQHNSISQNVSPKNQNANSNQNQNQQLKKMASLHSQHNHNSDIDSMTFMKGSFAPANHHQQLFQNRGRSGSQYDSSTAIKYSGKNLFENNHRNQLAMSFDNTSIYDKELVSKQPQQLSPSKNMFAPSLYSGQSAFFGTSPKWKPPSGTVSYHNSETNVSSSNHIQKANQQYIIPSLFNNNDDIEQSQQVDLKLSQSSVSVQLESKNHEIKDFFSDENTGFRQRSTSLNMIKYRNERHSSINNFKTNQTGQAMRKSLAEDFYEFDLRSSDEDSIIENIELGNNYTNKNNNSIEQPSSNYLICNIHNSSPLETYEKLQMNTDFNSSHQNLQLLNNTNDEQKIHLYKNISKKKYSDQDDTSLKVQNKQVSGQLEHLNLISSEIDGSQLIENQLDELSNQTHIIKNNLSKIPIIDSEIVNQQEQQDNTNSSNQKQLRKISGLKQLNKNDNQSNLQSTQEDTTPQSKIALNRGIQINPLIQRFKQTNYTTNEDFNSAESLQRRLSASSMLPSTNNAFNKFTDISMKLGSYPNLMKKSQPLFENQQGFSKSVSDKNTATKDLLFAMTLCHETKTKGDRQKHGKNVNNIHFEQDTPFILEFTKKHNFSFECSCSIQDQNYYILKSEEGNEKIITLQKFTSSDNKKFIISVQHNNQWLMFIRETSISFPHYLNNSVSSEKKQKLEGLLNKIKKQGEKIIFYSKIVLSQQQQFEFQNSTRLETSQDKLGLIYDNFIKQKSEEEETQIQLLGFVGIQEETDLLMKDMVKELRNFGQKIWVLTSDTQSSTLESCYNYKILQDNGMDVLDFSFANFDELFYKTRNHLQILKKAFQQDGKNNKENNMATSQLGADTPLMPQTPNVLNQSFNKSSIQQNEKLQDQKSQFAEQNSSAKKIPPPPLTKQGSNGLFLKRNTVFANGASRTNFQNEDESTSQQYNQTKKEELNYYILLSGESLNLIRNNQYLWDHFCLLAFFSSGVIGYEITDEQKSVLCSTIQKRFHASQRCVVNLISSLNDIERLGNDQRSIYVRSQSDPHREEKNTVISQHSEAYANDSMSFLNLLIRESRLQSEIIEETMYLAIHRSYLSAITIILWNISTCSCNYPLFKPYDQLFFQSLMYLVTQLYYTYRKVKKFNQDKNNDDQGSRFFYQHFNGYQNQYSPSQIPLMNLKVIISSLLDVGLIYLFFTSLYNFKDGYEMDMGLQMSLLQWGVYLVSFCRVFDLHFIKIDRYLFLYMGVQIIVLYFQTLATDDEDNTDQIMQHSFVNFYFLNSFLFLGFFVLKCIMEGILLSTAPTSIVGLSKYILIVLRNAKQDILKLKNLASTDNKSATTQNNNKLKLNGDKILVFDNDLDNRSPDQKQYDVLSQNQIKSPKIDTNGYNKTNNDNNLPNHNNNKNINLINNNTISMKMESEATSFNTLVNPLLSSGFLKNLKNKVNPTQIIRSIFKDKEMDIILSTMLMQEDINLSQTQMQKFTLKFQIKEIEAVFLKGWELLIPKTNRKFYILHFVFFDIGYDILVLSKVTNEFSSADGGYLTSYGITASAIFILTTLSLTRYYAKDNIVIISAIMVIVRSIKLILLSSFKQIIIYPTECLLHISIACSCLRFSHYNLLLQGLFLFVFLIILTETNVKQWNLQYFLEAIGYTYEGEGGYSDSINIIRICFYISYFIILFLYVTEKYNMMLTIRKNYLSEHNLFKATIKVKDILSILLPKFIREKIETMKQGQYRVAERQDEVVIVFCDICNFDDIIFNEKTNTVRILDKLYRQFDLACQQNGLQKIETVGKTYLAAAGISDVEKLLKAEGRLQDISPAKRALAFAFEMQKIVKTKAVYLSSNKKIIIKVGIHLGPAISGVIGYHKPQFSLIGDTVNTTSRVCSTGLSDHIIISNEVYNKVYHQSSQYKFQQRDVEAKGKGIMITYQVFDKKILRQNNMTKKPTLSSFDDTAVNNHNGSKLNRRIKKQYVNKQKKGKTFQIMGSSNHQIGITNASTTQYLMDNSNEKSDKVITDSISHSNEFGTLNKKQNSKQFIPLKAIPESPANASNRTTVGEQRIKGESLTPQNHSSNTGQYISINTSDKLLQKERKLSSVQSIRLKQTSFGTAMEQVSQLSIQQQTNKMSAETPIRKSRMLKKSSSLTIVDIKPRFKNGSSSILKRTDSGKEEYIDENIPSPLLPSKNEFIKQMEKDLLMRIELESEQIYLKELNLPLDKIQTHISHQDHGGNDLSKTSQDIGNSQTLSLNLGLCTTSGKKTSEQQKLHTEFLKSILKQQVSTVTMWLFVISIYFLVKVIIVINFTNIKNQAILMENNTQLLLSVFSASMFIIFIALALSFQKLHQTLSWNTMRLFLYLLYFFTLICVSLSDSYLDEFFQSITKHNLELMKNSPNDDILLDSVTTVTYPSAIIYSLEIQFIFMFFTTFKSFQFLEKLGGYAAQMIIYFIYSTMKSQFDSTVFFFIFILGAVHLRIQYNHMNNEVRNFNNLKTLEVKKEELDSLLKNLLPSHILEQFLNSMKKEIPLVCEELDNVTLLFADIAGFTKYSSTTDPIVVVNMLRKLFTDFDDQCLHQNVYKLYTIGDCYVCFGINNKNDRNPAQEAHNVVRFAFDMIRIIDNVRQFTNCNLQMRIGVHTGKLYGGIVGTEIVRYDIYGQDVIIANKMESNGESGHVMVSEVTKKLLEDHFPNEFIYEFKESVHIKQANKDIDGFLIRFNQNTSVYLENNNLDNNQINEQNEQ